MVAVLVCQKLDNQSVRLLVSTRVYQSVFSSHNKSAPSNLSAQKPTSERADSVEPAGNR